jgi:poly-gamma-glutamate capsule biosynthesis protein CapA/YwtB (metallophosphatase superfamily)
MGLDAVTVFLGGDVMLGRGVDQILPHPGDPALREPHVDDARTYVALAEAAHGPISRPVDVTWPWGDALTALDAAAPDVRLVNLESAITTAARFAPGKAVHYRMNPGNIACLVALRPDACALANNHMLDFGRQGLAETLDTLSAAGLRGVGAGPDATRARRPAVMPGGRGRVLVFSCGMSSSGIPAEWAATAEGPGINYLPDASARSAAVLAHRVRAARRPGDIVVVSVHWGSNWGYDVPADQVAFAHLMVDAGVDVVHGHSSHHPRPIEVYHGRLVLYGCGDLVDDYEGITGYERFRDDLRLLYLASVRPGTGELLGVRMVPVRARAMRLNRASTAEATWLRETLERVSQPFATRVDLDPDGALTLRA